MKPDVLVGLRSAVCQQIRLVWEVSASLLGLRSPDSQQQVSMHCPVQTRILDPATGLVYALEPWDVSMEDLLNEMSTRLEDARVSMT